MAKVSVFNMHDFITVKKYSDQQLQERLSMIEQKMAGISPNNEAAFELMMQEKNVIMNEINERRMIESLKATPVAPVNLTVDPLSEKENLDEEKNRQQNNY